MAVFEYKAVDRNREDFTEWGTVVARDEEDARDKLHRLDFDKIHVKRLSGLNAFFRKLSADVK